MAILSALHELAHGVPGSVDVSSSLHKEPSCELTAIAEPTTTYFVDCPILAKGSYDKALVVGMPYRKTNNLQNRMDVCAEVGETVQAVESSDDEWVYIPAASGYLPIRVGGLQLLHQDRIPQVAKQKPLIAKQNETEYERLIAAGEFAKIAKVKYAYLGVSIDG